MSLAAQYWFCHLCGFETFNPSERMTHIEATELDPDHSELLLLEEQDNLLDVEMPLRIGERIIHS